MGSYLYMTSNISSTNFFKLSSKLSIRLFLALSIGSGYSTIFNGASNSRSPASNNLFNSMELTHA
jgi:hypothetical protein